MNILTLDARHASADQRILIEQIRIVYDMLGRSSVFTLVLSAFVALVMREHGPIIWGWFAFQVALKLAEMI